MNRLFFRYLSPVYGRANTCGGSGSWKRGRWHGVDASTARDIVVVGGSAFATEEITMRQIRFKRRPKRKAKKQTEQVAPRKPSRSPRLTAWWFSQSDKRN